MIMAAFLLVGVSIDVIWTHSAMITATVIAAELFAIVCFHGSQRRQKYGCISKNYLLPNTNHLLFANLIRTHESAPNPNRPTSES